MVFWGLTAAHTGAFNLPLIGCQDLCDAAPLSSGNALPIRDFAACSRPRNTLLGKISLLGGELALPLSGGPRQPLDRQD
jgi:hypothetical protein